MEEFIDFRQSSSAYALELFVNYLKFVDKFGNV